MQLYNHEPLINQLDAVRHDHPAITTPKLPRQTNTGLIAFVLDFFGTIAALLTANLFMTTVMGSGASLPLSVAFLIIVLWTATFAVLSIYDHARSYRILNDVRRVMIAITLAMLILMGALYLSDMVLDRSLLAAFFITNVGILVGWRAVAHLMRKFAPRRSPALTQKILIVGANELGQQIETIVHQASWTGMTVSGYLDDERRGQYGTTPVLGEIAQVRDMVIMHGISEVVVALPHHSYNKLNQIILDLQALPVQLRIVPSYLSLALYRPTIGDFGGLPLINLRAPALSPAQRILKRAFDIIVSGTLLLLASPIMLIVALAIKLDSQGPVLFKQKRVGEGGQPFSMYKFRSMVVNAEALQHTVTVTDINGNTIHKRRNDPRITRTGRFIRKASLDELPQLINVLKGDMSLVGPRPELPWLVEQEYQPWQHQRFAVPQGITGWWQVNGRSDKPCHLNTEQDIYYIQNYSFLLDIKILLMTVPALLRGKGAF